MEENKVQHHENSEKKVEERKTKILIWLKDPYNLALVGIMIFAFAIRLYYFILTKNQPLWWDELCYGSLAKNFLAHTWDGTSIILGETHIRPLFFSFIWAFLMLFNLGEVVNRFLLAFVPSVLSVYFVYLIGKEIYDKKIGLISAAIFSVIWLNLFYSSRLLVHMVELVLFTSSIYFFIRATKEELNLKQFCISLILLSLATLTRYQDGMLFFIYFIVLIIGKKLYLNRIKFWYAGIIGILPLFLFFLMNLITQGNILPALFSGDYVKAAGTNIPFAFNVLNYIPQFLEKIFFIAFILGILYLIFDLVLGYNTLLQNSKRRNSLLLVLILIVFNAFFIFYLRTGEDRWFFETLISLTILAAIGIELCADYIKKYKPLLAIIFIIAVLLGGSYYELKQADSIINLRKDSYSQIKDAFQWIKDNTPKDAVIAGTGIEPYAIYYSDRKYLVFPENYSDINKISNATYVVVHGFVPQADYIDDFLMKNNESLSIEAYFFADAARTQPIAIIYKKNANFV